LATLAIPVVKRSLSNEAGCPAFTFSSILSSVALLSRDLSLYAALGSCLVLGLRHGFDYDHLAAISDITAVQRSGKQGIRLGVIYALGHAFTVLAPVVLVIMLHISLPERLDAWAERLIGVTLIILGVLVVANLVQHSKKQHSHSHLLMQSRWALLINGSRRLTWRVRRTFRADLPEPKPFAWNYSGG